MLSYAMPFILQKKKNAQLSNAHLMLFWILNTPDTIRIFSLMKQASSPENRL